MNYFCCTDTRRNAVKLHPVLNGIDYLEVLDDLSDPFNERQTTLFVHFLKPITPGEIESQNVIIEGGERIKNIQVTGVAAGNDGSIPLSPPSAEGSEVLEVIVSEAGDFSTYTLRLISSENGVSSPVGFDTLLSSVEFSFKAACPSDFDCKPENYCDTPPVASPEINYLTKDYTGFRQLMLDRMSLLMPGWKERNPADMGITLVELLAYSADYLSYRQDAIATEAYLGTARKRISVRRHARLVDYFMHDGCNARTWLHLAVPANVNGLLIQKGTGTGTTKAITRQEGLPSVFRIDSKEYEKVVTQGAKVFELMHDISVFTAHNEMNFYTWGAKECCLPKGATSATLLGNLSTLIPGDVLILCEILGPETGVPQDADPSHRHAVRLTSVTVLNDVLFESIASPPESGSFPVTEITWDKTDALPFPLCISSRNGFLNVSAALGNNVMIDHGRTLEDMDESSLLPHVVPESYMKYARHSDPAGCGICETTEKEAVPVRFNPKLTNKPLTRFVPTDFKNIAFSANALMNCSVSDSLPAISLTEIPPESNNTIRPRWYPRHDLLNSADNAKEFVVETESDGIAYLRFGNGMQGEKPVAGAAFLATYRIGNGVAGNIGALSLAHLVTNDASVIGNLSGLASCWNPLPAAGGTEPETIEEVKQFAPVAFRTQERMVVPADYEEFSKKSRTDIQHTATTLRWTGSWRTAFLTIDRFGGMDVDAVFEKDLRNRLEKYRLAGFDLEVDSPLPVSLEIEMKVCVNANFFASDVKAALLEVFSNRLLPNGRKGIFHPDNFSFGQAVYLSPLYAAAQSVQGVDSLKITKLMRQGDTNNDAVANGKLLLGRREIARLDNDRNFPEHGVFTLIMIGGR